MGRRTQPMSMGSSLLCRRRALRLAGIGLIAAARRAGAAAEGVAGSLPNLRFRMQRADTGAVASEGDFRGSVVLLYFGYASCPDICPTTLANLAAVLDRLGPLGAGVRVLFVSVDPARDTLAALRQATTPFGPRVVGLRPTPDMLDAVARRYRVAYSVRPARGKEPYTVTHATGVYVFDSAGAARAILTGLDQPSPDLDEVAAAIRQAARPRPGFMAWLLGG
jgi:protein SCO1